MVTGIATLLAGLLVFMLPVRSEPAPMTPEMRRVEIIGEVVAGVGLFLLLVGAVVEYREKRKNQE